MTAAPIKKCLFYFRLARCAENPSKKHLESKGSEFRFLWPLRKAREKVSILVKRLFVSSRFDCAGGHLLFEDGVKSKAV